jgi:DNA topoisomerase IB
MDVDGLVRSDPSRSGIRRRRCGRGFRYLDDASAVTDTETLTRIKALVIPPAWEDVWSCPDPAGGPRLGRNQVLAAAIRLIDLGFFRPGGEEYAAENGTYGLARIRRDHVTCTGGELIGPGSGRSRRDMGELATRGSAENAVLKLLEEHAP